MAFELGWKTLGDYLEKAGIDAKTPREIIKHGFKSEMVKDAEIWFDALDNRNLTTHTYDKDIVKAVLKSISGEYMKMLEALYEALSAKK